MTYYAIKNKKTDKFYCAPYEIWSNSPHKALCTKDILMGTLLYLAEYYENELEIVEVELIVKGVVEDEK